MAVTIKQAGKFIPRPRFMLYGNPGETKTSLAATLDGALGGRLLLGVTDNGVQSIAHRDLPYVDISRPADYKELIESLRAGKFDAATGLLRWQGLDLCGVVMDLWPEYIHAEFVEMCRTSPRAADKGVAAVLDDPGQYEYKKINLLGLRQMQELKRLPLSFVGMTAYSEDIRDKETGALMQVRPRFTGQQLWQAVCGQLDYVFRVSSPPKVKDAGEYRIITTQPTQTVFAKQRVPGVAGNAGLPATINYKLGHPDLLRKIFEQAHDVVTGSRPLQPKGETPSSVETVEAA